MTRRALALAMAALVTVPLGIKASKPEAIRCNIRNGSFFALDGTHLGWAKRGAIPRWKSPELKKWAFKKFKGTA